MDAQTADATIARVEGLLEELESLPEGPERERTAAMAQALVELYGEGLARILERLGDAERSALADDDLIAHLLLLHDLHPIALEQRVGQALDDVRPYLESHGGGVELLAVDEGVAQLRLHGTCNGCPSSTMTLKLAIEDAIAKRAPDIDRVEAEGAAAEPAAPAPLQLGLAGAETNGGPAPEGGPAAGAPLQLGVAPGLGGSGENSAGPLPLTMVQPGSPSGAPAPGPPQGGAWETAGGLPELSSGGTLVKDVAGEPILFARLNDAPYAYRPTCPACGAGLADATLVKVDLECRGCGLHFDLLRAGRCLDEPDRHLEPVPLLTTDAGLVKVAVGAGAPGG